MARRPLLFSLAAELQWADELDFGEARDLPTGEITPVAPVRGGVDDHRRSRVGQRTGHVDESAIYNVTLDVAVGWRRRDDLADLVELEDYYGIAASA
jgi:hypothetical protein